MKVTIYLKTDSGWQPSVFYEFTDTEFERLQNDFQQYTKTGSPKTGIYLRDSNHPDRTNTVILNFEHIAVIEAEQ
ncbi:MAG: hypothetical protein AB1489_14540 [Acidobacteriota bacterium]